MICRAGVAQINPDSGGRTPAGVSEEVTHPYEKRPGRKRGCACSESANQPQGLRCVFLASDRQSGSNPEVPAKSPFR